MRQDLRYAIRTLRKSPGFALVAVLTLTLGIGANSTIFSVVNGVLLQPLPYRTPERLVMVWENDRLRGTQQERASIPDFLDFRAQARAFEQLAAWQGGDWTMTGRGDPERLVGASVSANYFATLGVQPLSGRAFLPEEEQAGRNRVVVLGHGLWKRRFGSDASIVGQSITLDGESYIVAGVMPPEARILSNTEDLWLPLALAGSPVYRGMHNTRVYGRLKPGVSLAQAQIEMTTIMRRLEEAYRDDNEGRGAVVAGLHDSLVSGIRPALLVLLGAVGLVLLIACVNVANLLLARASGRGKEIAIRVALGAGRRRLVRQLLTENLVLALAGATMGLLFAVWGVDLLRGSPSAGVPGLDRASIDAKVLAFTLAVSLATWLVFGLVPALRVSASPRLRVSPSPRLSTSGFLVVSEIALAVVLLIGAGLLIRSFGRLLEVNPGYDPKNVLALGIQLPPARYPTPKGWPILEWSQVTSFQTQLLEKVQAIPGVESAALAYYTPASGGWTTRMTIAGRPAPPPGQQDEAHFRPVGEGYFRTVRLPLRRGRSFTSQDDSRRPKVLIINESFARRYFPDEDPIGRRVTVYGVPREIVGIARDEKFLGLGREVQPAMYLPYRQNPLNSITLIVRASADPLRLAPVLEKQIWSLDPDLAVFDVIGLEQALSDSLVQRRFTMTLLGIFAAAALALAAVGIYGVIGYSVGRRTHEIGIRMALGAQQGQVLKLILGQGFRLIAAGLAIGGAGAAGLTRVLRTQLFGISATDSLTFVCVLLLLGVVALAACYIPARRAARVDPMAALRLE